MGSFFLFLSFSTPVSLTLPRVLQILLIFLQKMDLLLTKTPADDIKNSVLPMVYRALEAPSVQIQVRSLINPDLFLAFQEKSLKTINVLPRGMLSSCPYALLGIVTPVTHYNIFFVGEQELCLNIIPTFANLIDYPSMKNSLIPRIKSACLQTSSLAVSRH